MAREFKNRLTKETRPLETLQNYPVTRRNISEDLNLHS